MELAVPSAAPQQPWAVGEQDPVPEEVKPGLCGVVCAIPTLNWLMSYGDGLASKENTLRKCLTAPGQRVRWGWEVTAFARAQEVSVPSPGVAFWQSDGRSMARSL